MSFFSFSPSIFYISLGIFIVHTDRVHVLEDRSLVLENVDLSDEGEYRCEADNSVGSVSAVGSLVIHCKLTENSPISSHFSNYSPD